MRRSKDIRTDGARKLRAFLDRTGRTQADVARFCGVSDPSVSDWMSGSKRPDDQNRDLVAEFTANEVTPAMWKTAGELAQLAEAAKRREGRSAAGESR